MGRCVVRLAPRLFCVNQHLPKVGREKTGCMAKKWPGHGVQEPCQWGRFFVARTVLQRSFLLQHCKVRCLACVPRCLPPVRVPPGLKESPSKVTDFFMMLWSYVTFLADSMLGQTNESPKTNFMAASRCLSYPTKDRAVRTLFFPTCRERENPSLSKEPNHYSIRPVVKMTNRQVEFFTSKHELPQIDISARELFRK